MSKAATLINEISKAGTVWVSRADKNKSDK